MAEIENIVRSHLGAMTFIIQNTARDVSYWNNQLLSYLAQDILESAVSVQALAIEGALSVAKREFRFLIEASVKLCYVQQQD